MRSLDALRPSLLIIALTLTPLLARAQDRNNLSPQERQLAGLRQALGITDDAEWNTLTPKLVKVQSLVRAQRDIKDLRRIDRLRVRQNDSGETISPAVADLADRAAELRNAYNDPSVPAAAIQRSLKVYREAREKADKQLTEDLATARTQLRDLVTARQELTLIMAGLLD